MVGINPSTLLQKTKDSPDNKKSENTKNITKKNDMKFKHAAGGFNLLEKSSNFIISTKRIFW